MPTTGVDIDHADGDSILEFVTKPFEEQRGTLDDAVGELERRLGLMDAVMKEAAEAPAETPLKSIAEKRGVTLRAGYQELVLDPGEEP